MGNRIETTQDAVKTLLSPNEFRGGERGSGIERMLNDIRRAWDDTSLNVAGAGGVLRDLEAVRILMRSITCSGCVLISLISPSQVRSSANHRPITPLLPRAAARDRLLQTVRSRHSKIAGPPGPSFLPSSSVPSPDHTNPSDPVTCQLDLPLLTAPSLLWVFLSRNPPAPV